MAREQHKPFTRTELKILVFNRMKKGYSYDNAIKYVQKEINEVIKNGKKIKEKKDQENKKDSEDKTFKESFSKLTKTK